MMQANLVLVLRELRGPPQVYLIVQSVHRVLVPSDERILKRGR